LPTQFIPTKGQLDGALDHVAYEIEQLVGICLWMIHSHAAQSSAAESSEAILEANVYLEAFLIHIRALSDFFERTDRTQRKGAELDDVLARDYHFAAQPLGLDDRVRQRINQELAHISYSRVNISPQSREWLPEAMARPLLTRCDAFAEHLLTGSGLPLNADNRERFAHIRAMIARLLS
jgi:hypothetical protein